MNSSPAWIMVLSALLTPTIALAVTVIAFLQWQTAERKRRQDLFDKRFALFNRLWKGYEENFYGEGPKVDLMDLQPLIHEAEFLFGSDIVRHMFSIGAELGPKGQHPDYEWFTKPFRKYLVIEWTLWRRKRRR